VFEIYRSLYCAVFNLESSEQAKIEEEIEEARKMIKDKATELKTMEGKLNQVGGFQLKGMTLEDLKVSK
jgi:hypothetical protein